MQIMEIFIFIVINGNSVLCVKESNRQTFFKKSVLRSYLILKFFSSLKMSKWVIINKKKLCKYLCENYHSSLDLSSNGEKNFLMMLQLIIY